MQISFLFHPQERKYQKNLLDSLVTIQRNAGKNILWDTEGKALDQADLTFLLLSVRLLAEYAEEISALWESQRQKWTRIFPVLCQPCDFSSLLGDARVLPETPSKRWANSLDSEEWGEIVAMTWKILREEFPGMVSAKK